MALALGVSSLSYSSSYFFNLNPQIPRQRLLIWLLFYPTSSPLTCCCPVLWCFYQIEMAIETLQKSEGLSSQRSSLLNSHVSCFYQCFALALSQTPARLSSAVLEWESALRCLCCQFFLLFAFLRLLLAAVEVLSQEVRPRTSRLCRLILFFFCESSRLRRLKKNKKKRAPRYLPRSSSGCWTTTRQQRA